jgi:hypothetical protein
MRFLLHQLIFLHVPMLWLFLVRYLISHLLIARNVTIHGWRKYVPNLSISHDALCSVTRHNEQQQNAYLSFFLQEALIYYVFQIVVIVRIAAQRLGVQPPCGFRSITKHSPERCKTKISNKRTLESLSIAETCWAAYVSI